MTGNSEDPACDLTIYRNRSTESGAESGPNIRTKMIPKVNNGWASGSAIRTIH